MPIDELERLRARAADLDVGEEALALYGEILEPLEWLARGERLAR